MEPKQNKESYIVNYVKQNIPKYRYHNDAYIRGELVNNNSFFNEITGTLSQKYLEGKKDYQEYYDRNPEEYQTKVKKYRANFRRILSLETSYGETVKSSITKRHMALNSNATEDQIGDLGLFYRQVIGSNPKDFKNTELYDENGIAYEDTPSGNVALVDQIKSSPELQEKIYSEKYNEFLGVLDNKNNQGAIDTKNVGDLVKAYVMYVENGSEGLTQFLNYKQDTKGEESEDGSNEALDYLKRVGYDKLLQRFLGGGEDRFEIQPLERTFDVKQQIPADRNKFTRNFYDAESSENVLDNIIGGYKKGQSWFDSMIERAGLKLTPQEEKIPFTGLSYLPILLGRGQGTINEDGEFNFEGLDKQVFNSTTEEIKQDIIEGNDTIATHAIYKHILNKAKIGEDYEMTDLIRTLAINAESYRINDRGTEEYVLDYNNMDAKTKLAFNALRLDNEGYASSVIEGENGKIYFQPEFLEREVQKIKSQKPKRQSVKQYYTEDGEIKVKSSNNAVDEPFGFLSGLSYGLTEFGYETIGKDFIEKGLLPIIRNMNEGKLTDFERSYRESIKIQFDNDAISMGADNGVFTAGNTIGYMAAYLATAGKIGKSAVRNYHKGAKTLTRLHNIKKYKDAQGFYLMNKLLGGRKATDVINKFDKLKNKSRLMGALEIEVGNMALVASDEDFSSVKAFAEMTGNEGVQNFYNTSGRGVQLALDIGTELTLTGLFDGMIAVSRSAGQLFKAKKLGKKNAFNTGVFDTNTNSFIYAQKNKFKDNSDLYRVYKNVFQGFQDINLGDLTTSVNSMKNVPLHELKTAEKDDDLAVMVLRFQQNAEPFVKGVRGKIKDRVIDHDAKYSFGSNMTDEQIESVTDDLYDNFMDKTAKELGNFFDSTVNADAKFIDEFGELMPEVGKVKGSYIFGDMLQKMAPRTEQYVTDDKTTFSYAEFLNIKEENPTSVVKRVGTDEYEIWKTDEAFWGVDLGSRMKAEGLNKSKDDILSENEELLKLNKSSDDDPEKLVRDVESSGKIIDENIGKVVPIDGNLGYIIDYNHLNGEFTILDEFGKRHKTTTPNKFKEADPKNSKSTKEYIEKKKTREEPKVEKEAREEIITKEAKRSRAENIDLYKKLIYKIEDAVDKVKKGIKNFDYVSTGKNDPILKAYGLGANMVNWLKKRGDYTQFTKGSARKVAKLLGTDNNIGYSVFAKNRVIKKLGEIPEKGIPSGTVFRQNIDGIDEYFITSGTLKKNDSTKPWVQSEDGSRIIMNNKVKRINPNLSFSANGEPMLYKKVQVGDEYLYRPAEVGETGVLLNVQRPVKRSGGKLSRKRILQEQFDAEEVSVDGVKHYNLINEGQQTVDPTKLKEADTKIYNSKTTVERFC